MNDNRKTKDAVYFILIAIAIIVFCLFAVFFKNSEIGAGVLRNLQKGTFLFPLVTVAALIDSVNPCAFSILFLTMAFLFSLGRTRKNIILTGGAYVAGVFVVYVLIGLGILQTLHFFNVPHFVAKIGGSVLIVSGAISLLNHFFPEFPIRLGIPQSTHKNIAVVVKKASVPSGLLLGVLVGMWEFPCTGGPYLMILGLLHDTKTFFSGFGYLLWYNFVFIIPLITILAIVSNKVLLQKVEGWKSKNIQGRLFGGVAMVILGILIMLL